MFPGFESRRDLNIYTAEAVAEEPSGLGLVVGHGVRTFILGLSNIRARIVSTENSPAPKITMRTDANRNVYGSAAKTSLGRKGWRREPRGRP